MGTNNMDTQLGNQNTQFDFLPQFKRPRLNLDDGGFTQLSQLSQLSQSNHNPPPMVNNNNNHSGGIFYKTRLCHRFKTGECPNGDTCKYAHGLDDLRAPPPNWMEYQDNRGGRGGGGGWNRNATRNGDWDDNNGERICKKYYNGEECPYGERCTFVHKDPPMRARDVSGMGRFRDNGPRESSAISIGITHRPPVMHQNSVDGQFGGNRFVDSLGDPSQGNARPYFKTKICTKWEMGACPYGEKCHYAHGPAELQMYANRVAENEPVNTSCITVKPTPVAITEPIVENREMVAAPAKEFQGNRRLLKWKQTKKINSIYADWIDDRPLVLPDAV